jgi:hypothetical protein
MYITPSNSKIFIGYANGFLESRLPSNMEIDQKLDLKSSVTAIISDDKVLYVALEDGRIVYFPCTLIKNETL